MNLRRCTLISTVTTYLLLSSCVQGTEIGVEKHAMAKVDKMSGIYVFIKSKPLDQYDYIGTVELNSYYKLLDIKQQSLSSAISNVKALVSFSENLQNSLTEIKQKYPSADGVVFNDDMSKCEIIKFK